jgi:hypothetical protein
MALALAATSCGGQSAPTLPGGAKIAILVFFDRGTAALPPEKAQQVNQLADWLEPDFLSILNNMGFSAAQIADPNTPPGPGRYVVRYRIINYNAGSKAARMFVGYGAGSARLDTGYELIGPNGTVYAQGAPSIASSRDWNYAARKVNQETAKAINNRLHQSL